MEVTRRQVEQAWMAFRSAFDYPELKRFLYFKLERELGEIVPGRTDFSEVCFELLHEAEKDGWIDRLIRAAIDYKPENEKLKLLATDLRLEIGRADSTGRSIVQSDLGPDTSDPLLVVEDFKKDLERIPVDQSWSSEEFEHAFDNLRSWLPILRSHVRLLIAQPEVNFEEAVLCELRFEDSISDTLNVINGLELCLNCLLDSPFPPSVPNRTKYFQSFRSKSESVSEHLSRLQHTGTHPGARGREGIPTPENVNFTLSTFIERLGELRVLVRRADWTNDAKC